jgi:predicted secreted hydrolase
MSRTRLRSVAALLAVVLVVAGCSVPVLANPPAEHPQSVASPAAAPAAPDPQPVVLPRDDAPHDRLTEWWYYTGHLVDQTGANWGFEFVVFRAERGGFPVSWASHLALTDEAGRQFHYAQRAEIGPQVNAGGAATTGFDLAIRGLDASDPSTLTRAPWTMRGAGGTDTLDAVAQPGEVLGDPVAGFGLALSIAAAKPPVLHKGDGYIDFGPAGGSYYYSRTSMDASGSIIVGGRQLQVTGTAWFDHQWGDFISVGGGGWDWFAVNLGNGTDVMLSMVRAADGSYPLVYGTLVARDGAARQIGAGDFTVDVTGRWTSPATGTTYPAGWTVSIPSAGITARLTPTVPQQELDTRATTGVVYWEGSQRVTASVDGRSVGGQAYVELTGYAPAK